MSGQPAKLENVAACVFDAYGTLFDVHSATNRCRDALGDKTDTLSQIWRQKQIEYTWQRSLRGDYVDFWHVTGQSLDYAMAAVDVVDNHLRARLMELYLVLDAYAEVRDVLSTLKDAGMKTAILSNGSPTMLVSAVRRAGIESLVDSILSVEDVHIYKPHPHTYQLAVDKLRVPAERIWFLSSNPWDASGAAHFGFRVVWVNRFNGRLENLPGKPEHEIKTLAELPPIVMP